MAIDQNLIPNDLRPLNLARNVVEENRGPPSTGFIPNSVVREVGSPRSRQVYYPVTVLDSGGNPTTGWYPYQQPMPVSSGGIGEIPNYRIGGNASDHGGDESLDDSGTVKKVKLMCSFGGKILPRPNDGLLRYVGGQTRIISVRRDISFQELVPKMIDAFGRPVVIKYQLPNEDLDALVSVSCPEDLENMMEEYEKLVEEGSRKLRMFLFSASELDASGLVQFSDVLDSGQKYIDAINGVGVGITRKESVASAASTHSDSQLSWGEAIESFAPSQGDGGGIMSPCMSSPRVVVAASHDAPTSLAYVHPNLVTYAEPIPVPMSHPAMVTVNSQNLASLRPEARMERSIPAILPQQQQPSGYNLQQPFGMDFRPPATYMQAYVDPRQRTPPPIGYVNPQLVGVPGSIYTVVNTQQQLQENAVGIPPQQFVPAVHMTMAPSALHASMNSNSTQHFVQPHQSQVNPYPGESLYGARVVQLPVEQSHGAYQPQATASLQKEGYPLQTGGYGWCQAPPVQTVTAPDGWVTHQAGSPPENIRQLEDFHMCQKALPHAHSDTLPQNHRDSMSAFSDKNHVFHGYPIDNQLGTQPPSSTVVSGATGERTAEQQDSGNQPRAGGYTDHDINTNHFRVVGVTQDPELQHGKESLLQIQDNLNQQGFFSHSVVENPGDVKTYGIFLGNVPQSYREDALRQPSMPLPYQVKQEVAMHQPVGTNFLPVNIISSFQSSESMVQDSSTQHMDKHPGLVPNNDISDSYILYNHVRPIDGRTEIHVSTSEISGSNEQCTSPVKRLIKEDISVGKPQIKGQDILPSNAFTMSGVYPDGNDTKPIETQPPSSSETSYCHNFQPVDSKQITQADMLGSSGPYPNIGVQQTTSDHKWHDAPPFTGVDSVDATDRYNRIGEWQAEALLFQSRMLPNDTMADPSSGISSSPSDGMVQDNWGAAPSNSLFSNQDPWTLHHDLCIPKTSNLPCREEVVSTTEEGVLQKPEGDLNKDSNVEHVRSDKEEHIRKELKAVTALVLQSSITSDSVHDKTELMPEAGVEDVKTKIPISDGIGHLQIIKNNDLEELRELGSGTFGIVYHGKWRGSDVAIKRINDRCFAGKPSEKDRMLDDFWNEAIKLADLHHPNVVAFYGVVLDGPGGSVATVTEHMVNGSLRQALQRNDRALDKRKRLLVAMDVAFGMEYLHEKNIVHFDLKSDNLLVNLRDTLRPICKVGDLGLSKIKCQTLISGGVRGTLPWMAPELLNGSSSLVSEKVDVFSFGIVMWELLTGEEPYADLHYGAIIGGIVNNTLRPSVPVSCGSEWRSLMESCWSAEPSERPSFTQIANMLRSMAASLPQKGQNQQQQQMQK